MVHLRDLPVRQPSSVPPCSVRPGQAEGNAERSAGPTPLGPSLRASWDGEDADPLLSTLESLRQQRLRLESEMRLLIAYGRCFTHPRPYKLIDLANAAGMSISGVRTAYDTDEIDQAVQILDRQPARAAQPSAGDG